jgi:cytoskeletal protein CcmA (bactofilin family)
MFRRKKPEGDEAMTDNEPKPETLLAPLTKPVPRPGATAPMAPPMPPNRVPNMPPRPSPTELARAIDPVRVVAPPQRPEEAPAVADPIRYADPGRSGEVARASEVPRRPDLPRRPGEAPRVIEPVPAAPPPPMRQEAEIRQLMVGRQISLQGEITHCDRLLIEGSVEANLSDCRDVDIAESGLFKGSAAIETAEIRGRFEGTLTVRKRLFIRATGRVTGTIRYGQIEVERGGRIAGDIEATAEPAAVAEIVPSRFG